MPPTHNHHGLLLPPMDCYCPASSATSAAKSLVSASRPSPTCTVHGWNGQGGGTSANGQGHPSKEANEAPQLTGAAGTAQVAATTSCKLQQAGSHTCTRTKPLMLRSVPSCLLVCFSTSCTCWGEGGCWSGAELCHTLGQSRLGWLSWAGAHGMHARCVVSRGETSTSPARSGSHWVCSAHRDF